MTRFEATTTSELKNSIVKRVWSESNSKIGNPFGSSTKNKYVRLGVKGGITANPGL